MEEARRTGSASGAEGAACVRDTGAPLRRCIANLTFPSDEGGRWHDPCGLEEGDLRVRNGDIAELGRELLGLGTHHEIQESLDQGIGVPQCVHMLEAPEGVAACVDVLW